MHSDNADVSECESDTLTEQCDSTAQDLLQSSASYLVRLVRLDHGVLLGL